MPQRVRHSEAESAQKYRQGSALLASGATILQASKKVGVSEATFHRWRRKFGRSPQDTAKASTPHETNSRLKQLEKENKRLKLLVAELMLENAFLNDRLEDEPAKMNRRRRTGDERQ